jgi:hypothetical protein
MVVTAGCIIAITPLRLRPLGLEGTGVGVPAGILVAVTLAQPALARPEADVERPGG